MENISEWFNSKIKSIRIGKIINPPNHDSPSPIKSICWKNLFMVISFWWYFGNYLKIFIRRNKRKANPIAKQVQNNEDFTKHCDESIVKSNIFVNKISSNSTESGEFGYGITWSYEKMSLNKILFNEPRKHREVSFSKHTSHSIPEFPLFCETYTLYQWMLISWIRKKHRKEKGRKSSP
jgi:hypothetical protein